MRHGLADCLQTVFLRASAIGMHLDTCGIGQNGLDPYAHDLLLLQFSRHAIDNAGLGPAIQARAASGSAPGAREGQSAGEG